MENGSQGRKSTAPIATMVLTGLLAALILGAGPVSTATAATCDTTWLGGDGNWSDAGNWSAGVPGVPRAPASRPMTPTPSRSLAAAATTLQPEGRPAGSLWAAAPAPKPSR